MQVKVTPRLFNAIKNRMDHTSVWLEEIGMRVRVEGANLTHMIESGRYGIDYDVEKMRVTIDAPVNGGSGGLVWITIPDDLYRRVVRHVTANHKIYAVREVFQALPQLGLMKSKRVVESITDGLAERMDSRNGAVWEVEIMEKSDNIHRGGFDYSGWASVYLPEEYGRYEGLMRDGMLRVAEEAQMALLKDTRLSALPVSFLASIALSLVTGNWSSAPGGRIEVTFVTPSAHKFVSVYVNVRELGWENPIATVADATGHVFEEQVEAFVAYQLATNNWNRDYDQDDWHVAVPVPVRMFTVNAD